MMQHYSQKPTWLTHRIWLTINWRRKMLGQLRDQNYDNFERILKELKIAYPVPKQPEHVKTRKVCHKAWAEAQLRSRVKEEKEKRLEVLHKKYESAGSTRLAEIRARREELEEAMAEICSVWDTVVHHLVNVAYRIHPLLHLSHNR